MALGSRADAAAGQTASVRGPAGMVPVFDRRANETLRALRLTTETSDASLEPAVLHERLATHQLLKGATGATCPALEASPAVPRRTTTKEPVVKHQPTQ